MEAVTTPLLWATLKNKYKDQYNLIAAKNSPLLPQKFKGDLSAKSKNIFWEIRRQFLLFLEKNKLISEQQSCELYYYLKQK